MASTAMARLLGKEASAASPKEDAAQDFLDAVKSNDAKAVALAFEALYEHCAGGGDSEESDEDEATYEG